MLKQIAPITEDILAILKNTRATIIPFLEKPAANRDGDNSRDFNATELFSFFTASIIREEVVFSR